ncbi:TadE/TadG family type IV pilus assembly protein [Nocardioides daejeonensis]|uniref:TadE/TadG family type IV pilus assembly protein n=1 Tax=Nocardioides daejeonensis TaxID=1046556 RepID=UPI000D74D69D|nr:pilus assembly protein TadG-related protein [Nocardioides daejeonensis]
MRRLAVGTTRSEVPGASRGRDAGATTLLVAVLMSLLMMAAALSIDISQLVNERQELHDTLDAAAHAGAYHLPGDGVAAEDAARRFATANDPDVRPTIDFWCVVAPTPAGLVDATQVPSTCDPGPPPYTNGTYPALRCNTRYCAIPCDPREGDRCNTIRVADSKVVPFVFAPVSDIREGSTGSMVSVACKGACGTVAPNPLDIAIVADRTGSMSAADVSAMTTGILATLRTMTPAQQYVALGTIGRSRTGTPSCAVAPSTSATSGPWVPVPFTADYVTGAGATLNVSSPLVRAVNCLGSSSSSTGTHLAAPMKAAARYLLGLDPNNLRSLPPRAGTPRKVLLFETDGQPNETLNSAAVDLASSGEPGGGSNGNTACSRFLDVATRAKAAGILVVTVAYNLGTLECDGDKRSGNARRVTAVLAEAASVDSTGAASDADNACTTVALRAAENSDGDHFYCAASGDDMASLFTSAISAAGQGIRLLRLP